MSYNTASLDIKIMGNTPEEIYDFIDSIKQNPRYKVQSTSTMMVNDQRVRKTFRFKFFLFVEITKEAF